MRSANVQVTVELIVDAKDEQAAVEEASRVLKSALTDYGWHLIVATKVIHMS